ncbi:MAG TPA: hypothetical protein VFG14_03075 [Chthoniobacteraceae bacterium]|nr:hypothetical protein [Chthoniobacteraceae bacterium]
MSKPTRMTPSTELDPFFYLGNADDADWPSGVDFLGLALSRFDATNPAPLVGLLLADEPLVVRRGLFLFGVLGKKAFPALDAALKSVNHPVMSARSNLTDGVICYPRKLNPGQAHRVLKLANDEEDLVRGKVVAFLGASLNQTIQSAVELFDEPERSEHMAGLQSFDTQHDDVQAAFDQALATPSIRSTYVLASIERLARSGGVARAPQYAGGSFLGQSVSANIKRLARR